MDWLKKQHNSLHKLDALAFELTDYSRSFHVTGNVTMENNLARIANDVMKINKDIRDAIGEHLTEEVKRSSESSAAVFLAALSGIKLAEREV